jgi:hypothetical protein
VAREGVIRALTKKPTINASAPIDYRAGSFRPARIPAQSRQIAAISSHHPSQFGPGNFNQTIAMKLLPQYFVAVAPI